MCHSVYSLSWFGIASYLDSSFSFFYFLFFFLFFLFFRAPESLYDIVPLSLLCTAQCRHRCMCPIIHRIATFRAFLHIPAIRAYHHLLFGVPRALSPFFFFLSSSPFSLSGQMRPTASSTKGGIVLQ
ncbi:hypothetical protein L873DRAFT_462773 [Choiromyces venosus 120613-1]|uniref:Uncharacterized protein n=1 Tax=Choiromyces venosus 120613-1 TaxID=1336337 RepID=A0A3N4K1Y3_9PEZI|nr:hypothetical protein L873DRAFT_462773 [Choiromyces venosus 120613-1]